MNLIRRILVFFRGEPSFEETNWKKAPLSNYMIHDIAEGEAGEETGETYNYYRYIHSKGRAIIMRINSDETEMRYATGSWSNRTNLEYKVYSAL